MLVTYLRTRANDMYLGCCSRKVKGEAFSTIISLTYLLRRSTNLYYPSTPRFFLETFSTIDSVRKIKKKNEEEKKNVFTLSTFESDRRAGVQEPEAFYIFTFVPFSFFLSLSFSLFYHIHIHSLRLKRNNQKRKKRRNERKRNFNETDIRLVSTSFLTQPNPSHLQL
ncbi:hypothetical protein ACMFMG_010163 [Clarireedia jacksonii]